jgi:hypothetical protein
MDPNRSSTTSIRGTDVTEYPASEAVSLRLDVGIPDHFAPLLGVVDNELAKLGGRGCIGLQAQIDEPRLKLRAGKRLIHELIEDGDARRPTRSPRRRGRAASAGWALAVFRLITSSYLVGCRSSRGSRRRVEQFAMSRAQSSAGPAGSSAVRLHHFRKHTEGDHGRSRHFWDIQPMSAPRLLRGNADIS